MKEPDDAEHIIVDNHRIVVYKQLASIGFVDEIV